jgi:hypothetical protein
MSSLATKLTSKKPQYFVEEVIQLLKEVANLGDDWIGAEWWIQNRGLNKPLFFHFDADQTLSNQQNPCWKFPDIASILYITETGGPTLILNQRMAIPPNETDQENLIPPRPYKGYLVYPKENQ